MIYMNWVACIACWPKLMRTTSHWWLICCYLWLFVFIIKITSISIWNVDAFKVETGGSNTSDCLYATRKWQRFFFKANYLSNDQLSDGTIFEMIHLDFDKAQGTQNAHNSISTCNRIPHIHTTIVDIAHALITWSFSFNALQHDICLLRVSGESVLP